MPLSSKLSGLEKGTLVLPNCPHFFKTPKRADYFPTTYKTSSAFTDTTTLLSKCCVPTFNNSCGSVMMKCSVSLALSSATCFASFAVSCKLGKSRPAYTQIQIKVHLKNKKNACIISRKVSVFFYFSSDLFCSQTNLKIMATLPLEEMVNACTLQWKYKSHFELPEKLVLRQHKA